MPRGQTLGAIRASLKQELGIAPQSSNPAADAQLNLQLRNRQLMFAMEFDWPFLEARWDLNMVPAQNYYTLPTVMTNGETAAVNFDRDVTVAARYNLIYLPVGYGIGIEEYNIINPETGWGSPSDPVMKWRMSTNVDEEGEPQSQIEVWPPPASAYPIRFTGRRQIYELFPPTAVGDWIANTANYNESGQNARDYLDAQKADLDDLLLIHSVAAENLTKAKQASASVQANLAANRLRLLKATSPSDESPIIFGQARRSDNREPRRVPLVTIHG